jgi:hypothetical protein
MTGTKGRGKKANKYRALSSLLPSLCFLDLILSGLFYFPIGPAENLCSFGPGFS